MKLISAMHTSSVAMEEQKGRCRGTIRGRRFEQPSLQPLAILRLEKNLRVSFNQREVSKPFRRDASQSFPEQYIGVEMLECKLAGFERYKTTAICHQC
jgi:hypothetical protein